MHLIDISYCVNDTEECHLIVDGVTRHHSVWCMCRLRVGEFFSVVLYGSLFYDKQHGVF